MHEGGIAHIDGCCLAARYPAKDLELEASAEVSFEAKGNP